jgi:predicted ferric reductase
MSSMMGGMDRGSEGPFRPTNERIAHALWYSIAGAVGMLSLSRGLEVLEGRQRRAAARMSNSYPCRPRGPVSQSVATMRAFFRELAYSQPIYFTGRISRFFSPLPTGRWLILTCYWILLLCFLWSDTILYPDNPMYAYKWEKVGFRAAWVSVTQIPFIYLLSCKFNPISMLTGISYERFNWLHRWAARTVFLTVIVHWSFFFREWWLADFIEVEIKMMPMVKYGFGAWSTIGWMVLSGFGFFRHLNYEIFVAQHICAAATLLWLLHTHVPGYAAYNIYISIGFVAFDWSGRIVWALLRNFHIIDRIRARSPGYTARLEALPGDVVRVVLDNPCFKWKGGQHVYLTVPRLGPFETHPFTIASTADENQLSLLIKAHGGFSKRLHKASLKPNNGEERFRAFLSGPWGLPPDLRHYDTLVLIACSSGATFVFPVLRELLSKPSCVRIIHLHWVIRSQEHLEWFRRDLDSLRDVATLSAILLQIIVHFTTAPHGAVTEGAMDSKTVLERNMIRPLDSSSDEASSSQSMNVFDGEKIPKASSGERGSREKPATISMKFGDRPTVESMIRPPVEAALGETAIVVCGGVSITAQSRTFVAGLSDERAVHKGSGAQGIFLFTESYGW